MWSYQKDAVSLPLIALSALSLNKIPFAGIDELSSLNLMSNVVETFERCSTRLTPAGGASMPEISWLFAVGSTR